jgi:hypothetical protein
MNLLEEKIKNKTFNFVVGQIAKYRLGKNGKAVKILLESHGATIKNYASKEHDYVLLGLEHSFANLYDRTGSLIFENELIEQPAVELKYFQGLEARFYDMLRRLYKQPNVSFDFFSIGKGLTEDDFAKIEKKFKRKLPAAVKEFYSIFGHIKLLWSFNRPSQTRRFYLDKNAHCLHSGQHEGSIHIMPLTRVLSEDWGKYHSIPENKNLKIFDYYSLYHMLSFELSDKDNPDIYRGEDHGVCFDHLPSLSFSTYINMVIGAYAYINRFKYLEFWTNSQQDSILDEANLSQACSGFLDLDFDNKKAVEKYIVKTWEKINEQLHKGDLKQAFELARWFLKYDVKAYAVCLDFLASDQDEAHYFHCLQSAIENNFDLADYEKTTQYRQFLDTAAYREIKEAPKP